MIVNTCMGFLGGCLYEDDVNFKSIFFDPSLFAQE